MPNIAAAAASFICFVCVFGQDCDAATGDRLDRSHFRLTFEESWDHPIDMFDPEANPLGRWKTNYDFGWQAGATSRSLPSEYQLYSDLIFNGVDPFTVSSNTLEVEAKPTVDHAVPKLYTSGLLTTSRSFQQVYGYFETTMKLPAEPGAFPAFWLATPIDPAITKPQYGDEIDIMEALGKYNDAVFCSIHWPDGNGGTQAKVQKVALADIAQWHTYGVLWTEKSIRWYIDGIEVVEQANVGMHRPMNILLNLAVGGWDENKPKMPLQVYKMQVGPVRAYSLQ